MKYIVIFDIFRDLKTNHVYTKGDTYPFDDTTVSDKRIKELSSTDNLIGHELIRPKKIDEYTLSELIALAKAHSLKVEDEAQLSEVKQAVISSSNFKVESDGTLKISSVKMPKKVED